MLYIMYNMTLYIKEDLAGKKGAEKKQWYSSYQMRNWKL